MIKSYSNSTKFDTDRVPRVRNANITEQWECFDKLPKQIRDALNYSVYKFCTKIVLKIYNEYLQELTYVILSDDRRKSIAIEAILQLINKTNRVAKADNLELLKKITERNDVANSK